MQKELEDAIVNIIFILIFSGMITYGFGLHLKQFTGIVGIALLSRLIISLT